LTEGLNRSAALHVVARGLEEGFGAHVWFVEILGRRWSYIAGEVREEPADGDFERLKLKEDIGMVVESWGSLGEEEKSALCDFVRRLVRKERG